MPRGSGRGRLAARLRRHGLRLVHAGGLLRGLPLWLMGCLHLLPSPLPSLLSALRLLTGARLSRLRLLSPW